MEKSATRSLAQEHLGGWGNDWTSPKPLLLRFAVCTLIVSLMILLTSKIESLTYQTHLRDIKLTTTVEMVEVREHIQESLVKLAFDLNDFATLIGQDPQMSQPEFNIKALDILLATDGMKRITAAPDEVVSMVFPKTGNEQIIGRDYREFYNHDATTDKAIWSGEGQMVGPILLKDGSQELVLRKPIFLQGKNSQKKFWGTLSFVLDYDEYIANIGVPQINKRFDILAYEAITELEQVGNVFLGDRSILEQDPISLHLKLPFGTWILAALPVGGWPDNAPGHVVRKLKFFSLTLAILAFFLLTQRIFEIRHQAERQLAVGIEALDSGFVMFGPDRRIVAFNQKYKKLAGGSGMVHIGARYEDIVKENIREGLIPDAIGREQEWYKEWLKRFDGEQVGVGVTDKEQILADGRMIRAYDRTMEDGSLVGLRTDITDLRKAQLEAERANKAKTDFMGVLSHELRTPLTVILGHTRLAKNMASMPFYKKLVQEIENHPEASAEILPKLDSLKDQMAKMLESVERSGNHLFTLISEILDFAKIESGTLAMEMQHTTVPAIVDAAVEQVRLMVEDKGLSLKVERGIYDLVVDSQRIKQVLINLIGNAAKFTDEGSISLDASQTDDCILFRVTDTGIGIPDAQLKTVFEAFHQVDSTAERMHNGTGLGLAISRDIALAHGGEITVSSELGKGSVFTLRVPRFPSEARPVPVKTVTAKLVA
ncbi:ATP-binding protein [Sulfitobacter sp. F26204]|uniref:ATP-binding protein n=1 Tax=Sulfitobacter sp. F26204 TaxID=2996014 RepID=UPI00225E2E51|nr:ATP-binding protein [Sulfitobacter sp. F26204]MCX7559642.1 ATP-binding protein [Sulfitobacter sp. F26204]